MTIYYLSELYYLSLLESNTDSDVKSYYELESVANLLMDQKHAANEFLVAENENLLQVKTI